MKDKTHSTIREHVKNILILVGLSSTIAFTMVITVMAAASGGALIYFYEPNTTIMIAEVAMGLYGVVCCFYLMYRVVGGKTIP